MRRFISLLIIVSSCVVAAAQQGHKDGRAEQADKAAGKLEALDRRLNEAFVRNDAAALNEILAEDWYGPAPFVVMAGKDVALENFRKLQQSEAAEKPRPDRAISIYDIRVRIYGDTATVTGRYTLKSVAGTYPWAIKYLDVFVKRRGTWQVVSSLQAMTMLPGEKEEPPLINDNEPSPPPPTRPRKPNP